jgi:hypothetical protein
VVIGNESLMRAAYRLHRFYPVFVVCLIAVDVATVPFAVASLFTDWNDLPYVAIWTATVGWVSYWWLRLCYRVDLDERTVRWRTPLRSGRMPLERLRAVRPHRFFVFFLGVSVLEFEDGPRVPVRVERGFAEFAEHIRAVAPHVTVTVGVYARMLQRLPGRRNFRVGGSDR